MVETHYEHVILDEQSVPIIRGTTMKVAELAFEHVTSDRSAEELKYLHQELTLGQIYSALAYYYDHQEQVDNDIVKNLQDGDQQVVEQLRSTAKPLTLWERLRVAGLI